MIVIRIPTTITDTSAPQLVRDELLVGDSGGVQFLFDLANQYVWPGGNPTNGATVRDLSSHARDGSVAIGGGAVTLAGGGFDFSGVTSFDDFIAGPAAAAANLYDGTQHWLVAFYIKLPSTGDWVASGSVQPWFQLGRYASQPDLVMIGPESAGQAVSVRRQTASGTAATIASIAPNASDHGTVVQLAAWRTASGCAARYKGAAATTKATAAVGSNNTQDWSARAPTWGIASTFWGGTPGTCRKVRIYRGWIENLATSGRDPETILDADWTRTVARAVYS